MAYNVFGFVKYGPSCDIARGWVHPYFKQLDSGSDPSKWADTPYQIDSNGYYSFDVNDTSILGFAGTYKKNKDKLYIAFYWQEDDLNNQDRNSPLITHAAFIDHQIIQADFYELNIELFAKRAPVVTDYQFPTAEILTEHTYTMSESSYADYSWETPTCGTEELSQKYLYDNETIFDGHQLINTVYDWGEIAPREVPNNSSDTYVYDIAGVYDVSITVREKWNTETILTHQVTVRYNEPVPDFHWTPTETNTWDGAKIKGQENITFINDSTDLDGRTWNVTKWGNEVYTYDWTITDKLQDGTDNTQSYTGVDIDFQPQHQFQSEGTKTIILLIHWNDGFQDKTVQIQKTLEVHPFRIIPEFDQNPFVPENRGQIVTFNPDLTTGDTDKIVQYDWIINDRYAATDATSFLRTFSDTETSKFGEESSDPSIVIDNQFTFTDVKYPQINYHSNVSETATLTITYYDGWKNVTISETNTINKDTYDLVPEITVSNYTPLGRAETATFDNSTPDPLLLQYTVDWRLQDEYSLNAYDNPDRFNSVTDNYIEYLAQVPTVQISHNYQSTGDKNVELEIRYDNGWQEQTEFTNETISPIVYDPPVPDFDWTPEIPIARDVLVQFNQLTSDPDNRGTLVDWFIQDEYELYNPDNPNYGTSITDNQTDYNREPVVFKPSHYFQSINDSNIVMNYYYDDGFEEQFVTDTDIVTKTKYVITADWDTTTDRETLFGQNSYGYINLTEDLNARTLEFGETWMFIDNSGINTDTQTNVFDNHAKYTELAYTFAYPSRKPFSAVNGATDSNYNKEVNLLITYDNGWNDVTTTDKTRMLEAKPYEIEDTDIIYQTNTVNCG